MVAGGVILMYRFVSFTKRDFGLYFESQSGYQELCFAMHEIREIPTKLGKFACMNKVRLKKYHLFI